MRTFHLVSLAVFAVLALSVVALAQGPPPPQSCEEQLHNEMFQAGGLKQQLAVAQERLRVITKERDDLKAAAVKGPEKK